MAVPSSIDVSGWLHEQLAEASPDLLRAMVQAFAEALMSAEADAVCGAAYGERSGERTNTRNGYRRRGGGDTRAGALTWRSRGCAMAATSRAGCWSAAAGPRRRW